jgi:hypothetical protein
MRPKHLSGSSELPADFDIGKYDATRTFQIEDWVVNLEMRVFCAFLTSLASTGEEPQEVAIAFAENVLRNPIYPSTKILEYPELNKNVRRAHVRDMEVLEALCFDRMYMGEALEKYYKAFDKMDKGEESHEDKALLRVPIWKVHRSLDINDSAEVYVTVDLRGTEQKITADFVTWLRQIRESRNIRLPEKRLDDSDFKDWAQFGVLPYLDLTNWATVHGKSITQQVLGVALFPDELDVTLSERIRKTVRPLASGIAHETFTDALRSQALGEIAERNIDKSIPDKWHNISIADGKWVPLEPE